MAPWRHRRLRPQPDESGPGEWDQWCAHVCFVFGTVNGLSLFGHQLGAADGVTVFETVSTDGNTVWDFLFLDLWHPKKSRLLPKGTLGIVLSSSLAPSAECRTFLSASVPQSPRARRTCFVFRSLRLKSKRR